MFNFVENNKACMNKHLFISFFNIYLRYIDMVYEYKIEYKTIVNQLIFTKLQILQFIGLAL